MIVAWETELLAFLNFEVLGFAAYIVLLLYAFLKATMNFAICCYNQNCPSMHD